MDPLYLNLILDELYDRVMALIEPELMSREIPKLAERHANESDQEAQARQERYQQAFAQYDQAVAELQENLRSPGEALKEQALQSTEKKLRVPGEAAADAAVPPPAEPVVESFADVPAEPFGTEATAGDPFVADAAVPPPAASPAEPFAAPPHLGEETPLEAPATPYPAEPAPISGPDYAQAVTTDAAAPATPAVPPQDAMGVWAPEPQPAPPADPGLPATPPVAEVPAVAPAPEISATPPPAVPPQDGTVGFGPTYAPDQPLPQQVQPLPDTPPQTPPPAEQGGSGDMPAWLENAA